MTAFENFLGRNGHWNAHKVRSAEKWLSAFHRWQIYNEGLCRLMWGKYVVFGGGEKISTAV